MGAALGNMFKKKKGDDEGDGGDSWYQKRIKSDERKNLQRAEDEYDNRYKHRWKYSLALWDFI